MAKTSLRVKAARPPKYKTRGVLPLPPLRPLARGLPQVRHLPHLPARARARRLHPRHDQVAAGDPHVDDRSHRRHPHPHPQRHHAPQHDTVEIPASQAQARDGPHPPGAGLHHGLRGRGADAEHPGQVLRVELKYDERPPARSPASSASRAPASAYYVHDGEHPEGPRRHGHRDHLDVAGRHDRPRGPRSGRRRRGRRVRSGSRHVPYRPQADPRPRRRHGQRSSPSSSPSRAPRASSRAHLARHRPSSRTATR